MQRAAATAWDMEPLQLQQTGQHSGFVLQMFAVARVFSRRARAMLGAARLDVFARARASFRVQQ